MINNKLKGKGRDSVTVMVYMIGSDLESQSGMATADLNEMLYAGINNKNVNVFVQTGGAKRWKNSVMNAKKIQRWTISGKGIGLLEENKSTSMTDEEQLADFIQYCTKKAPADRNILIFWDHGGGSVSGYGHDELYPNDTMNIGEIARALKTCGKKFDFIGFDTCLMATLETAIAIEPYADYMIASEESEPGTGWYYTNWMKMLSDNSSTNTLNLGRQICDDFTTKNAMYAGTLGTTLSVTDLGELGGIVEARLSAPALHHSCRARTSRLWRPRAAEAVNLPLPPAWTRWTWWISARGSGPSPVSSWRTPSSRRSSTTASTT